MAPLGVPSGGGTGGHRDSLELASLASSSHLNDDEVSNPSSRPSISSSRRLSLIDEEDPLDDGNPAGRGRMHRSYSVSSGFDFAANLFPLSSTTGADGYAPLGNSTSTARPNAGAGGGLLERNKTLTYFNGLSLIIGLVIGSGIFSSPSQVNSNVGSPGAALIVWIVSGLLVWTGASSYAELGGSIPLNGGPQVYLAKIFGELSGFLFTWVAVLVLKPGSAAIIAIIMGEYLVRAFAPTNADELSPWVSKGIAMGGVVIVTIMNCISTKMGTKANDILMLLKFVALIGVTITGIVVAITGFSYDGSPNKEWKSDWFTDTSDDLSAWAVALYAGLWAYDGWDNTSYVVGEFINPSRDLPRVIHTAMPLVILSYVAGNVVYFLVLPIEDINSSNTVAVAFGHKVFGPIGALVLALVVSASCFGALNSSTFTSSRLIYVAGKEGYIPGFFGRLGVGAASEELRVSRQYSQSWFSKKARSCFADGDMGLFYTPIFALILNLVLTLAYCVVGEFGTLVTFYGVAGYTFYFMTVLGVIVLRVKEPNLERPYKTWIVTPVVFCCVSLFLLSRAVFAQPLQTVIVIAFVLVGIPVFFLFVRRRKVSAKRFGDISSKPWWKFWQK
ncbi:unnamed protein product [Clonostachys rosea f. rosea IK726]|uniref:Amino acid permease/ SLC12A domain-containing protein n=2 Tax=Bionectria ochroleuca TaxID=29856 RepID=A0A0B7KFB7_BIOOC|nr:unnamed protein product [Clonostachys rosea f. rosea IK726]